MTTTIGPKSGIPAEDPSQFLLYLVVSLLAPMFLGSSSGNVLHAHRAAYQTVMAYRARTHVDLLIIAQIVGFGLAALHAISLSLADNIPIPLVLRCLAAANACNRSGEQKARALEKFQARDPAPDEADEPAPEPQFAAAAEPATPVPTSAPSAVEAPVGSARATPEPTRPAPEADTFLSPEAEYMLAAESHSRLQQSAETRRPQGTAPTLSIEQQNKQIWAGAMLQEAADLEATLPSIPPEKRPMTEVKMSALNDAARELLQGTTATLGGAGGFAAHMRAQPDAPPIR